MPHPREYSTIFIRITYGIRHLSKKPFSEEHALLEEYKNILKVLPDIVYKIDARGKFVFLSDAISMLGYKPEELMGKHYSTILHPDDVQRVSRDIQLPKWKGKATGDHAAPKIFDERRTGKRGTRNLVIRLIPKNYTDLAAREKGELLPVEVVATGQYKDLKKKSETNYEGTVGEMTTIPIDEAHSPPVALIGRVANFGKYDREVDELEKKFSGSVGIIRDITERMKIEDEKRALEQQLLQSKKMEAIGDLAGGITHDFNNLLSVIEGHIDVLALRFGKDNPSIQKYIGIIKNATHDAADLTGKLLAFARKGKYQNAPIEMCTLISDVIGLLKHTFPRNMKIQTESTSSICWTQGDPNQLKNALLNIAINARDAMPHGGTLSFVTEQCTSDMIQHPDVNSPDMACNAIHIIISDTGIGMKSKVKDQIFVPFFTTKPKGKGTGLGMASVYGIMESHHGSIQIESEQDKGTAVHLYLPYIKPSEHAEKSMETPKKNAQQSEEPFPLHSISGHVLVVDDEEWVLSANVEMLQYHGFKTTAFDNAEDAIAFFEKCHSEVDLALLDVIMPDINGIECFQALRKVDPGIKAIMATGYSMETETQTILLDQDVKLLQKPFNHMDLLQAIIGLIGKTQDDE